jgi:2-C-methyl-D-erythritol 4-phosphate cytidylyltransferase
MSRSVIIVAGGIGTRMQTSVPKQFLILKKKPLLYYSLKAFYDFDPLIKIILVLPEKNIAYWNKLKHNYKITIPHEIVCGGTTRFQSVKNGLANISDEGMVAIHDGVRPFVSAQTIKNCFDGANSNGNAIPVIGLVDSIREHVQKKSYSRNRENYTLVQTPQTFVTLHLKRAYEQEFSELFTDDASVLESAGEDIFLVEGNMENIKITTKFDLLFAKALLQK